MMTPREAVEKMKQAHANAYQLAKEKYVPYWLNELNKSIMIAANNGRGMTRLELRWAERLGANNCPDIQTKKYTERLLDEELNKSGYRIVKLSSDEASIPKYEIWWFVDAYDMFKEVSANGGC